MLPNLTGLSLGEATGTKPGPGASSSANRPKAYFMDRHGNPVDHGELILQRIRDHKAAEERAKEQFRRSVKNAARELRQQQQQEQQEQQEQETCPMPEQLVVEPIDEGSSGPIFPPGASPSDETVVESPRVPHIPNDSAAFQLSPEDARTKIKVRVVQGEASAYAQKHGMGQVETLRAGGDWCPNTVQLATAARERPDNPTKYHAHPDQLFPINHPMSMGVAVYKVLENQDVANGEVAQWRAALAASVNAAPEFKPVEGETPLFDRQDIKLAVGGFAALAHPSSFHNEFARALRFRAETYVVKNDIFGLEGGVNDGKKLEQIIDRTMIRRPGQTPTAEAWHRDIARGTVPKDQIFGGWINLDPENPQYFSCVPGSSDDQPDPGADYESGFAKIGDASHPKIISRSYRIVIPPGHMIVFDERTIHEVAAVTCEGRSSCRLFFGWRITDGNTPLFYDLDQRLLEQDGMPLKSGQHKHAYSDPKCGARYKAMKEWDKAHPERSLIHHKTRNSLGFKNYPGGPPMYPSSYWGQQDPKEPEQFCANLRPCLLKMRYFVPSVLVLDGDGMPVPGKDGKPKTRAPKESDLWSSYIGSRFKQREVLDQAGVPCNFDLNWNDDQDGRRRQWSLGMAEPLKPDTMRSLAETAALLRDHPEGASVQWMQPPYQAHEVAILKPHTLEELRQIVQNNPQRAQIPTAFQRPQIPPGM